MLYKIFKFYLKKIDPELAHKLAIVFIKISSLFNKNIFTKDKCKSSYKCISFKL